MLNLNARLLLCIFYLLVVFLVPVHVALAQPLQSIALFPSTRVKEGDVASNVRIRNKIILGGARNLTYQRTPDRRLGISLQKGEGTFRLVTQNVVSLIEITTLSKGTFTFWDNNAANQPIVINVQSEGSLAIETQWALASRSVKFSWANSTPNSALILTSVTLGRRNRVLLPTSTPTADTVQPTLSPPPQQPTVVPTIVPTPQAPIDPTILPTMPPLPQPTATQIPTLAQTATPSPTSDSCPGFVIEGFARGTTGGCGGSVYTVTTLEDPATSVPGTFRYGVENLSGKRIIKFGVSGTLALRKDISIRNGDLTIDGSNAPGAGVQFSGGTLIVEASNVILRHLRILVGPYSQNPGKADNIRIAGERGFWVENVVVDHCSLQWATDENLSITGMARNVTVQWSIVAEGLYLSTHGKVDPHSMGALFHHDATRMTLHHNLFAHNNYRNPQLASRGTLEWINNVVYNTRSAAGILQTPEVGDENWLDAIGNFNKMGPNSDWAGARFRYSWREGVVLGISHLFVQGNFDWNRTSPLQEERAVVAPYLWKWISPTRLVTGSVVAITSAAQAYDDVIAGAGATAPCRSPVDKRIIQETQQGAGGFINYPSERGGWPDLTQGCS